MNMRMISVKFGWNTLLLLGLSLNTLFVGQHVLAKPNLQPLAANIAETGSAYYQFKVKDFESKDQQRKYRVWLGVPKQHNISLDQNNKIQSNSIPKHNAQNINGLPSITMLDGNSVMARLDETLLKTLAEGDAPVLIAIGYQTNLPFDSASRSLDYTPADASGQPQADPRNPQRMSGGSTQFRELISNTILPWVESEVTLDNQRKALWGHSYGGLFVLDSFLSEHQFSHYFAVSPSLGWADQRILQKVAKTSTEQLQNQKIVVMEGDLVIDATTRISPNMDKEMIKNNRKLIQQLDAKKAEATLVLYPNLSHGEVFQRSLMDVLKNRLF